MEKQIDQLIQQHKDLVEYGKYTLECSVSDFKRLQKLMSEKYKIKDDWGKKAQWRHNGTIKNPTRTGIVKFNNFEIKVICKTYYEGDFMIIKHRK